MPVNQAVFVRRSGRVRRRVCQWVRRCGPMLEGTRTRVPGSLSTAERCRSSRKSNSWTEGSRGHKCRSLFGPMGAQWWAGDEDLHFHVDGYKLKRTHRNGQGGGDIQLIGDIKDRASWAHVAAAQTAALKQDWPAVRRELILSNDWPSDRMYCLGRRWCVSTSRSQHYR